MWLEENGYREEVLIGNGIEVNGELWCSCSDSNCMYCIDTKEAKVKKKITFDGMSEGRQHPFSEILVVSGCLYLIPYMGRDMVKYHIMSGKTEYIDFGNLYAEAGTKGLFIAGSVLEQYLYLFPYDYQNIIRFNTENKQIVPLPMPKHSEKRLPFIRRCITKGNSIWITEDGGNRILQVNMEKMQSKWFALREDIHICDFCMWDEKIFCLDTNGKVILFDTKTEREVLFADINSKKYGFIEKSENYLWLIPNDMSRIVRYSEEKIEEINYPENFVFSKIFKERRIRTFSSIYSSGMESTIMPRCNNVLIKIDKIEEKIEFIDITYSKKLRQNIKEDFYKKLDETFFVSEIEGSIEWLFEFLKVKGRGIKGYQSNGKIGNLIYWKIINKN